MNIVKEFSRQQKLTLPFEDYYSLTRTNRIAVYVLRPINDQNKIFELKGCVIVASPPVESICNVFQFGLTQSGCLSRSLSRFLSACSIDLTDHQTMEARPDVP